MSDGTEMTRVLDRRAVVRWRRDIWRVFDREGFTPAEINAAMVFAGVVAVGTNRAALSELTGLSPDYVRRVLRRLRRYRVLRGQTLRVWWGQHGDDDFGNEITAFLDAGVAAGIFTRPPDEKRSAAQKARKLETFARGPRGHRQPKPDMIAAPKHQKSNPLYGLPEWEAAKASRG